MTTLYLDHTGSLRWVRTALSIEIPTDDLKRVRKMSKARRIAWGAKQLGGAFFKGIQARTGSKSAPKLNVNLWIHPETGEIAGILNGVRIPAESQPRIRKMPKKRRVAWIKKYLAEQTSETPINTPQPSTPEPTAETPAKARPVPTRATIPATPMAKVKRALSPADVPNKYHGMATIPKEVFPEYTRKERRRVASQIRGIEVD